MAPRSARPALPSLALVITLPLVPGCSLLNDILSQQDGNLETRTFSATTTSGRADLDIDITDEASFELTATSGHDLAVEDLFDPDGNTVMHWEDWYSTQSLTSAIWLEGQDTVFNWPIRAEDGKLSKGTWTVSVGVVDNQGHYVDDEVAANVKLKTDSDLSKGTVRARIVYAEGLMDDPTVVAGVEDAVATWKDIWGAYGLNLEESYESSSYSLDQPFPGEGAEDSDVAAGSGGSEITVLVGETIDGSLDYYGIAGSIPGTLAKTNRALVIVSWLANSGGDGQFNSDDTRLFGETLAHECGHYLGLFHPVETTFDYWDALSDTQDCSTQSGCENNLGENLMFPYPVCDWISCVPQQTMTDQQGGVTQRYTGTL